MVRYQIALSGAHADELTLDSLAKRTGLHPLLVEQFAALGIIEPSGRDGTTLLFDVSAVVRLRVIVRLRNSLGVNSAGAAVILDLVDKMRALQRENQVLRSRLGRA
jgi:DNA-binding transcriptional MerR regulator